MIPTSQPKKRTVWKRLLLGLAGIAALYACYFFWLEYRHERELQGLLSQLNAEDPTWSWDKIETERGLLKPEDNGAYEVVELLKLTNLRESIPLASRSEWARKYSDLFVKDFIHHYDSFLEQHPNARLPKAMRAMTEPILTMEPMPVVLGRAHGLRKYQAGRFDYPLKPLLMWSLLPDAQGTRGLANLLAWDADLLADRLQGGAALEAVHGMLGVARSFEHDPWIITMLIRMAITSQACRQTARLLAQPVGLTSKQLQSLQNNFERELSLSQGLLTRMIRSERALLDHDLSMLSDSKISFGDIAKTMGLRLKWSSGSNSVDQTLVNLFPEMLYGWGNRPGHFKQERLALLTFYSAAVKWSVQPEHNLISSLEVWKQEGPRFTPFLRQFYGQMNNQKAAAVPEIELLARFARAYQRNRAHLRAVIALLACERYRLDRGSWPTSWEQLIPEYMKQIPLDPYSGMSMTLKPLADGMVIYAIGDNGNDDGGDIFPISLLEPSKDVGLRLWNPAQRGINLDKEAAEYLKEMK